MNESLAPQELPKTITRDEVVAAYQLLPNIENMGPSDLDLDDPAVQAANDLFDQWRQQEDAKVVGSSEGQARNGLSQTMLYVDAGFHDADYLDEVLNDWIGGNPEGREQIPGDPERAETRHQIAEAIQKIRHILAEKNKSESQD